MHKRAISMNKKAWAVFKYELRGWNMIATISSVPFYDKKTRTLDVNLNFCVHTVWSNRH